MVPTVFNRGRAPTVFQSTHFVSRSARTYFAKQGSYVPTVFQPCSEHSHTTVFQSVPPL